jgi:hypothetical protein
MFACVRFSAPGFVRGLILGLGLGLSLGCLASCTAPYQGVLIQPGAEIDGTLSPEVAPSADGKTPAPIQAVYALQGHRGEQYVIALSSQAFDPYLSVRGPGSFSADNDDDPSANGSLNSRLALTFPEDGVAQITVTSFQHNQTGAFHLSVQRAGARPAATGAPVASGHVINGELAQGDDQLKTGEFVDTYPLDGHKGEQLEIRLSSDAFDTYVAITGPEGYSEFNDDDAANNTKNSRLIVSLPEDGQYVVHVTSYQAGETGAYRLEINPTTEVATSGGTAAGANGTLSFGQSAQGRLEQGDGTLRTGEFVDRYRFVGQAGQRVAIDMHSSALDSYLILVSPSGAQEDNDDATPGQRDARIVTTLTESGDYAIAATSYRRGESGDYTISLQQGEASGPVTASSNTAHRVFAVMVGISDYPGAENDLPFTAEDARKLRQTLTADGVLADQSVVLVDAQATRASLRSAFARVAAAAGPGDLFLFFFSGHGGQVPAPVSAVEPDGKSETIELYDGAVTDTELGQMFAQVHSHMALLVLDSCFSGGFARNVITRPGIMGLFSSEEDLTSAVAEKFQAGGYLSHFIQTGLSGDADENHDHIITAGELSAFVRQQFAQQGNLDSENGAGERNYQYPVVDRGGIDIDEPVLALR